ncbi:DUF1294 domain-containing protein [Sphingomonas sp. SUN039]|uniref:DUF1294 domain-containing protein n=1 Tax=Sphingomonas sp. SUN039 TaxID=2937787 RepID=UPI002164ACAF|nr:DUF1294 domain-containing protein [Sphingomonas sp. SUN039]UVO53885.1 DUF1294 domain-containing protein [Sphingomonas sp. SUN039]
MDMAQSIFLAWIVALGLNVLSFVQFGWDKRRAELGLRRTPEGSLLMTGMLGGCVGAYLGRSHFRHKTRKQPFGNRLFGATILNVTGVSAIATRIVTAA